MDGLGRRSRNFLAVVLGIVLSAVPAAAEAAPPPNDAYAARTTISAIPYEDAQSTIEATSDPDEPVSNCGPAGKSVWYQFTSGVDTVLRADTLGSDFDTMLAVWTGSSLSSLSPVACSDDVVNSQSIAVFAAEAGVPYLFQVGGYDDSAGALTFRIKQIDAGTIAGTVTDEASGSPLADVCIDVVDADFYSFNSSVTDASGEYRVPVRSGSYKVVFYDRCDAQNDHISEWYDGKADIVSADEVAVTSPAMVSGIDASLAASCPGAGDVPFPQYVGTDGPDVFTGTDEAEVFCGRGGKDVIRGEGARDRITGGAGPDRIFGGAGSDYIWGEKGADRLAGGAGGDYCNGGKGRDRANRSCERIRNIP